MADDECNPRGEDRIVCVTFRSPGAGAWNFYFSALRFYRRRHFKFDAVRVASDLAKIFWIHSTGGPEPPENLAERHRVHDWNFCLVHRACVASDCVEVRWAGRHLG